MYRDGFAGDPDSSSSLISLLSFLNAAYRMMCRASFAQELFTVSITTSGEADIPEKAGEIQFAYWGTSQLVPVTYEEAVRRYGRSGSTATGTPTVYYTVGRRVGVFRRPASTSNITLRATTVPDDLAATTDVPSLVPPRYHEALALLGTILLCISDADDGTSQAQAAALMPLFETEMGTVAAEINARSILQRKEGGT